MIEFHLIKYTNIDGKEKGKPVSVSVDKIAFFHPSEGYTTIFFDHKYVDVWESYDEVKDAIDGVLK